MATGVHLTPHSPPHSSSKVKHTVAYKMYLSKLRAASAIENFRFVVELGVLMSNMINTIVEVNE